MPALLAIAASALTAEALVGWTQAKTLKGRAVYQQRGVPHPRYGWTWQPSSTLTERALGRDLSWAFNQEGFRVRNQDDEPDPALPTILFTGESIGLGLGLDYAETYPALIAARRGVQCVNVAANACGSDQAYLRLIDAMPRFRRLVATVTLFVPVQLSRNLHDDRPRLVLGPTSELEFVPVATDFFSRLRIRKLLWNELPYLGDKAIEPERCALTSAILRETSIRTRARGATPLFVIPSEGPHRPLDRRREAWIIRALFVRKIFLLSWWTCPQICGWRSPPGPARRPEDRRCDRGRCSRSNSQMRRCSHLYDSSRRARRLVAELLVVALVAALLVDRISDRSAVDLSTCHAA